MDVELGKIYPWFHGMLSRLEAENLLIDSEDGVFLIRVSNRSCSYALSMIFDRRPRHYKIRYNSAVCTTRTSKNIKA